MKEIFSNHVLCPLLNKECIGPQCAWSISVNTSPFRTVYTCSQAQSDKGTVRATHFSKGDSSNV